MAIRVTCPSCDESFSVSDSLRGKKTKCKECGKAVTVPAGKSKGDPDEEGTIAKKARAAVKPPKRLRDEEDDDEDDEEEEEEERPSKRGKKKGSSTGLLLAVGGGGLLIIAVVLFLVLGGSGGAKTNQQVAQNTNNSIPNNNAAPAETNPEANPPAEPTENTTQPPENPTPSNTTPENTTPETKPAPVKVSEPKVTPVTNTTSPADVVVGGALSGEKVYQRLLKSTVWIVAPQNAGIQVAKQPVNPENVNPAPENNPQPENNNPQPEQPAPQGVNLAGTTWVGNETLPGYGPLRFMFRDASNVTMVDAKDTLPGTYSVDGNSVTLTFAGNVTYSGNINGNTMSGTANNTKDNWTWQLTKQGGGILPNKGFPKKRTSAELERTAQVAPVIGPGNIAGGLSQPGALQAQKALQAQAGAQAGQGAQAGGGQGGQGGLDPNQQKMIEMMKKKQQQATQGNQNPMQGAQGGLDPNQQKMIEMMKKKQEAANPKPAPVDTEGNPTDNPEPKPKPPTNPLDGLGFSKISTGTGVLVDKKHRLVVTNVHVVGNPAAVKIHFPEFDTNGDMVARRESYMKKPGISGRVVMQEPRCDLALVQLDSLPAWVQALPITKTKPMPGQQVHSVGNPGASPALFIYSPGKVRQVFHDKWTIGGDRYDSMILETDSPINPGDSGGPLVNERGAVVGIAHAVQKSSQISMFIEASEVRTLMDKYFKSINEVWVPEPEAVGPAVNITQMTDWIKKLEHKDVAIRVQAAQFLGNLGTEGTLAFSPLFKALKDDEELVRRAVGDAIEKVTPHKADLGLLSSACKDEAEPMEVRLHSVKALARLGPLGKSALPHLLVVAKGSDETLKRAALESLVSIGPEPNNLGDLVKLWKGANADSRKYLLEAFAKLGPNAKEAAPQVALLTKSSDKATRLQAMATLQAIGSSTKEVTAALIDLTKESDKELGVHAALTLAKLGEGKGMVTFLKGQLKSGSEENKLNALKALAECGPDAKGAVIELATALDDDKLRDQAIGVLMKVGKPASFTTSQKLLALVQGKSHAKARLACLAMLAQHPQGLNVKENFFILQVLDFTFRNDPVIENKLVAAAILKKVTGKEPSLEQQNNSN